MTSLVTLCPSLALFVCAGWAPAVTAAVRNSPPPPPPPLAPSPTPPLFNLLAANFSRRLSRAVAITQCYDSVLCFLSLCCNKKRTVEARIFMHAPLFLSRARRLPPAAAFLPNAPFKFNAGSWDKFSDLHCPLVSAGRRSFAYLELVSRMTLNAAAIMLCKVENASWAVVTATGRIFSLPALFLKIINNVLVRMCLFLLV